MTTEPTRADGDSIGSLHPLGIAEVPRGWRAFSRDGLSESDREKMDIEVKARGGRIEQRETRADGGKPEVAMTWYLIPISNLPPEQLKRSGGSA